MIPEEASEKMWNERNGDEKATLVAEVLKIEDVTGFVENFKIGHRSTWLQACEYMRKNKIC